MTAIPPGITPEFRFRHQALLVVLACLTVTGLLSLALTPLFPFKPSDLMGLAFIAVKSLVLLLWLRRRPEAFLVIGLLELTLEVTGGLLKFASTLLVDGTASGLGGASYWLPVSYLLATLVLPGKKALAVNLSVYVLLLTIGLLYAVSDTVPTAVKVRYGNALVQLYLLHAAVIAVLALLDQLRQAYLRALTTAAEHQRLANLDALTGLPNRRQLTVWLQEAQGQTSSVGAPFSVILFDLDHFKRVNDTYGHTVGDDVLRHVSGVVQGALRAGDRIGRWGGEEFLVVLRCDAAAASGASLRLMRALGAAPHPVVGVITVSGGVAQARPGKDLTALLNRVDEALYTAKREGRNRMVTAEGGGSLPAASAD
ncbi:GGDEF domain-containing protein [Deinococcus navajonensis]|uniref:GGDEF domain-containing protein n=1 Tax=Deinococcus navajonensis TaxID=309884 RepID=A0ABV8XJ23_9DEIO